MIMIKMKNHHILCIGIERIYMDGQCLEICLSAILRELKIYLKLVDFIENYNGDSDEGHFLEVDVQYPKNLKNVYNDLPFSPEKMKTEKVENLVANLHNKIEYVIYIYNTIKTSIKSKISI